MKTWSAGEYPVYASDINANFSEAWNDCREFVYGEAIDGSTTPVPVYLATDGKVYKASSSDLAKIKVLGFAIENKSAGETGKVQLRGKVSGFSFTLEETVSEAVDQQQLAASGSYWIPFDTNVKAAQIFAPGQNVSNLTKVSLYLKKYGSPTGTATVAIYALDLNGNPTGSALTSTTFDVSTLTTSFQWYNFDLPDIDLELDTQYALTLAYNGTLSNYICWSRGDSGNDQYDAGWALLSKDGGSSWNYERYKQQDLNFKTWYTKKVYGRVGDKVWLSGTAGQVVLNPYSLTYPVALGILLSSSEILIKPEINSANRLIKKIGVTSLGTSNSEDWKMLIPREATSWLIDLKGAYNSTISGTLFANRFKTQGEMEEYNSTNFGHLYFSHNQRELTLQAYYTGGGTSYATIYFYG